MKRIIGQISKNSVDSACNDTALFIRSLVLLLIICFNISFISCIHNPSKHNSKEESYPEHNLQSDSLISQLHHWWDDYDFDDVSLLSNDSESEQLFVDFIYQLPHLDSEQLGVAINNMLDQTSVNRAAFTHYTKLYKHYLNDPNSPLRNDMSYSSVLEYLLTSDLTSASEKELYQLEFDLLSKNKPGDLSVDFSFVNIFGAMQSLHSIDAVYKLLVFYDPGCHTCAGVLNDIDNSLVISNLLAAKTIKVLSIMPWNDYSLWREYQSEVPQKWINGFDRYSSIFENDLYTIQAFPTLYLIDKNNKVVLKDADLMEVEYFLENN